MYSPGSAQISTTLPCSTIIMHWPSLTTMTDPFVMILSSPEVLELLPRELVRFCPFAASVSLSRLSQ